MEAVLLLSRDTDVIEVMGRVAAAQSYMLVLCEPDQARSLPVGCKVRGVLFDRDAFGSDQALFQEIAFLSSRYAHGAFIVVSASLESSQQIQALDAGCQLCLAKPLDTELLLAHFRAFERSAPIALKTKPLRKLNTLELDIERFTASASGAPLPLTQAEFILLEVLTRQPGKPVHHEALGNALWGWDSDNYSGHLKCHISRLRTKLASASCAAKIICIRGAGYAVSISPA